MGSYNFNMVNKLKLNNNYYHTNCYWAQAMTFRCSMVCSFCIMNIRGRGTIIGEELSGVDILNFWNNVEHPKRKALSLLGGEPTLHKDIVEVVNNLEDYAITITTNCRGPFYNNPDFYKKFNPKPSSSLRINTSFHPKYISAEEYIRIVKSYRDYGYSVDQISSVFTPDIEDYAKQIQQVQKELELTFGPYLGFWNIESGYDAELEPQNLEPQENHPFPTIVKKQSGITDIEAYKDICGQYVSKEVICEHPMLSLLVSPNGNYYHCSYKLAYDIDPVGNITKKFKQVTPVNKKCKHYGFCFPCDIPRLTCKKNITAKPIVLNKLYEPYVYSSEVQFLIEDIEIFARMSGLEYNKYKWFEYTYFLLYSGHRRGGKVLDVGSAKSVLPYYLAVKGYDVTCLDIAEQEFREEVGKKYNVKSITGDLREFNTELEGKFDFIISSSVIEHIDRDTESIINLAKYLKRGGVMGVSTDFYERYIEYPNANREIINDSRPDDKYCDSRCYTEEAFMERIVNPLKELKVELIGETNYKNVDITDPSNRCINGYYTFGIAIFRRF